LIKTGEIVDPNYSMDEKGEIHYLFGKKEGKQGKIRVHTNKGVPKELRVKKESAAGAKPRPKKRKTKDEEDIEEIEDDGSGSFQNGCSRRSKPRTLAEKFPTYINPLPNFIDPITLCEVERPAISPYGHVMGYDTWIRCLSSADRKNICPITKNNLTKRELVILTIDNIDEYR
jgi:hypothetical protein